MIKLLSLENFQKHENTTFNFSDGINIISGSSDNGKTAAFRAFLWALENRPLGNAFIRHGADYAEVGIENERGTLIRHKSDTENYYIVNGEKYEALKGEMPPAIQAYFNINDVNIQRQLDAHFLISESAGEVARFFNRTLHLDDIDDALKWVDSEKRSKKAELKHTEGEVAKLEKELQKYSGVELLEKQAQELEEIEKGIAEADKRHTELDANVADYLLAEDVISGVKKQQGLFAKVEEIYSKIDSLDVEMTELMSKHVAQDALLEEYQELEKQASKKIPDIENTIDSLQKYEGKLKEYSEKAHILNEGVAQYKEAARVLDSANEEIEHYIALMPKTCPLCGGKV